VTAINLTFVCLCVYVFVSVQTPVVAVVGNDACWSQIARDQIRILGQDTACRLAVSYDQSTAAFRGVRNSLKILVFYESNRH